MKVANIRTKDCEAFLSLKILQDKDTIKILELLLDHYQNFDKIYFNYKLYKILQYYTEELFCSIRESKRPRRAFRTAVGMKLKILSFFIL